MSATYHVGDVFDVMATLPDDSVDLVLTSPPFLALRSYLPDDDPNKGREIGQEATPAEFLDTLLALTAEWGRLLAPHGSIAVELGDTYSGSSASGTDQKGLSRYPNGRGMESLAIQKKGDGWPLAKSLCGIPTLYAWSLAYGRNLLTGEESPAGRWRIRNVVAWVRPNPPVGALGDKFRPATSYITIATQARDRWFDLDAVRTEGVRDYSTEKPGTKGKSGHGVSRTNPNQHTYYTTHNPAGAPPLDWWEVSPEAYSGSHYATWPRKLLVRPIESMCPRQVCRTCGEPRRRIVDTGEVLGRGRTSRSYEKQQAIGEANVNGRFRPPDHAVREHVGWTDCGHDDYRRGIVLDPFAGSGTTLAVATGLGRDAIGIDLDARNADLARERVGMLLEVAS